MSVVAPWDGTPLFEQILFFFTDLSTRLATDFLVQVLGNHSFIDNETFIWELALQILPPVHHAFLKSQIEVGFFNPRGEMYREMARNKGGSNYPDVMIIGEKLDVEIPAHILISEEIEIQPFELQFGVPKSIIYANLRNVEAAKLVNKLISIGTPFSLRPTSKTGKFGVNLRGFGIEMRPFKYSMEYGIKDSIILESKKESHDLHDDPTVDRVNGLPESYFDLTGVDDFSHRLVAWLNKRGNESLPLVLRDLTNNYPLFINEILNTTYGQTEMHDLNQLNRMRQNRQTISSINGRQVTIPNLDVFNLLDIVNKERSVRHVLSESFKLNESQLEYVFGAPLESDSQYVYDTRSDFVHYYNDVETDTKFRHYADDISVLYRPLMQLPKVRRNLIQYVMYTDPTTIRGLSEVYAAKVLLEEGFPMKIGIFPTINLGNKMSRKVAFAFNHISRKVNDSMAIQFLVDSFLINGIDQVTRAPNTLTEGTFRASYEYTTKGLNVIPWTDIHTLYAGSPEFDRIERANQYLKSASISYGACFMNGRVVETRMGIQSISYEAQQSIMELQKMVQHHRVQSDDPFDSIEIISRDRLLISSLNKKVMSDRIKSIGISDLPVDRQNDFIDFIKNTKWDVVNEGKISSYYLLFCNESTDIKEFLRFANMNRPLSAQFAINPNIPESLRSLFPTDPETPVLIANGRVYTNINISDVGFLELVDKWSQHFAYRIISNIDIPNTFRRVEAICYLQSLINDWRKEYLARRLYSEEFWKINNSLIYTTQNSTADLCWDIAIDPTTRDFQRISSIIYWVEKNNIAKIRLCILPPLEISSPMTIFTTFYRNSLDSDMIVFSHLNDTTTYSTMPDMPLTWVTESLRATTDLDNILLSQLNSHSQEGVYILTNILLEGSCLTIDGGTAEGTELSLIDEKGVMKSDTIAMMNGYFQLQANPGKWSIELGGACSRSIYTLDPTQFVVYSFASHQTGIEVKYRPGMEGLKVTNLSAKSDFANSNRVDVFSVASGHLYERLMKIMMLSVRSQSKFNVKFWIIKNFLSPTFKATLPIMSKQYNFSYQLITYKWPIWLRQQVEKQRIIWGNKILFLDTIFPLDLERVIYIDSDQIIRTDLNELMRMDFNDAPYAFTPMCNSREETEPFRFWRQGYWLEHLQGRPYHISALFAIDLIKFRQMAAGDWLRNHYQQLSQDPGSLANLDQDLPNYAQDHIPIFSLPQEWLWCETWCSDETMATAKTIDLCNNPLTKAPKLEIAQNRIQEWPHFDELARNISAGPDDYQKIFFP